MTTRDDPASSRPIGPSASEELEEVTEVTLEEVTNDARDSGNRNPRKRTRPIPSVVAVDRLSASDAEAAMNRASQGQSAPWIEDSSAPIADEPRATSFLRPPVPADKNSFARVPRELALWASPRMREVREILAEAAVVDVTVLITGETGTGKELIARAIHRRSPRSSHPFVAVNCAVIPKDLIASELFGHEKGAFTGAVQRKLGRFELAEGGTLFLDELGEIPPGIQVALLRVLQERRFERVGGTQSISSDVRVIAATNVDPEAAMNAGAFRRDLFYRLDVFPIHMPSLRERREDIPLLVGYFIERFATQAGKRFSRINKKSLDLLQSYDWPGNVRELQNVIERSVILCDTEEFSVDQHWLASPPPAKEPTKRTLNEQLIGAERKLIEAALAESGGKVSGSSGAAVKLGMPATTLYSKIQSLKIDRRCFKRY